MLFLILPFSAQAHIGSPNIFFEGRAGEYPVHVIIHPAEVIPGLAEISVRVDASGVQQVSALPMKWNLGREGAPPSDIAKLVPGETNLYNAQLWFMEEGPQSVEIAVIGSAGQGRITVPVDAIARRVLSMPKALGGTLVILGVLLAALLLGIIGGAVRESMLEPGLPAPISRRRKARWSIAGAFLILVGLVWGGKHWWDAEAADYQNNRLYKPLEAVATIRSDSPQPAVRLEITDAAFAKAPPLVPDHGKLMHLFLMREPSLDAFAHLHPIKRDRKTFDALLPPLPAGSYRVYADVTYETGLSDTITTLLQVPEITSNSGSAEFDPDDSWRIEKNVAPERASFESQLSPEYIMQWDAPKNPVVNQPVSLKFSVHGRNGAAVQLEPYLGMRGHLALRRDDGTVFTHLHPGGSPSMAAMQLSVLRTQGELPLKAAFGADEPICQLPALSPGEQAWLRGYGSDDTSTVSFPYAFPRPGKYRLWVQVRVQGQILTGMFDAEVGSKPSAAPRS